jgi:hypothetical protein
MMFQDRYGRYMMADQVDELSAWEIEERGIRVHDDSIGGW